MLTYRAQQREALLFLLPPHGRHPRGHLHSTLTEHLLYASHKMVAHASKGLKTRGQTSVNTEEVRVCRSEPSRRLSGPLSEPLALRSRRGGESQTLIPEGSPCVLPVGSSLDGLRPFDPSGGNPAPAPQQLDPLPGAFESSLPSLPRKGRRGRRKAPTKHSSCKSQVRLGGNQSKEAVCFDLIP